MERGGLLTMFSGKGLRSVSIIYSSRRTEQSERLGYVFSFLVLIDQFRSFVQALRLRCRQA